MRKLPTSPRRGLIIAVALAVAAAVSTGTTTALAATTGSSASCSLGPATTCQSTNPTIAINSDYTNATKCIFGWQISWGDGTITNVTVTDPANGYVLLAKHTYATSGTYAISAKSTAITANCTAGFFNGTFTVRLPASASETGQACVLSNPASTLISGHFLVGHVGWAFELPGGKWEYGANNGPSDGNLGSPSITHVERFPGKAALLAWAGDSGYKEYRCVTVSGADASAALSQAASEQMENYEIPSGDCEAQVYRVLGKYGVHFQRLSYIVVPVPNKWFADLQVSGFGPALRL